MAREHLGARVGGTLKGLADDAADMEYEGNLAEFVRQAALREIIRIMEKHGDSSGVKIAEALKGDLEENAIPTRTS